MISNITFEYPYIFLLFILFLLCLKFCKQKIIAIYFPNQHLLQKASTQNRYGVNVLKILLILSLVTALSSPITKDDIVIQNDKGYEISLILDASGSMEQSNKFAIVKQVVTQFIDERKHDKIALSIFADFAYVAVPLTYDKNSIKRLLNRLDVGIAGTRQTALYEALFLSSNLFKTSKAKEKIAILLTDGINTADTIPLNVAIKTAKKYGIKVYTIGVGNDGDFDPAVLNEISTKTKGKYFSANSIEKLKQIYSTINALEKSDLKADKYIKKSYYFQYPLGLAILLFCVLFYIINRGEK